MNLNKKYNYNGETVTMVGMDGDTAIVLSMTGYFSVDKSELTEIPEAREPVEETDTIHSMITEIRDRLRGTFKVREVPAPSAFPEVGARLRFRVDGFRKTAECAGNEVKVTDVAEDGFFTTTTDARYGSWWFAKDWQDGLELVTEPPVPAPQAELPQGEWRELGPDDGEEIITDEHEVTHLPGDKNWVTPDISLGVKFGPHKVMVPGFRARRRVTPNPQNSLLQQFVEAPQPVGPTQEDLDAEEQICAEQEAFEEWHAGNVPDGDATEVQRKWRESSSYNHWLSVAERKSASEASYPPPEKVIYRCPTWRTEDRIERVGEVINVFSKTGKDLGSCGWTRQECEKAVSQGIWTKQIIPAPEQTEEEKAKAALGEGWLWFGKGPLKVVADGPDRADVSSWYDEWADSSRGASRNFHALRAGSPIARANGLEVEPVEMLRTEYERMKPEGGDYPCGYRDGLAFAIKALSGKGGES